MGTAWMICAAVFDLVNDDEVIDSPAATGVYFRLLRIPLIFVKPQDVKSWLLAEEMHVKRETVATALDLLVTRGYLVEHERGYKNIRRVTAAIERNPVVPLNGHVR